MSNIEAYEAGLEQRLEELRLGDPSYELHRLAVTEAIAVACDSHNATGPQKVLDVGCGLGFASASLSSLGSVVGIDSSAKAIEIARLEHAYSACRFFTSSAESFPGMMPDLGLEPFDHAILNMVLHSNSDEEALAILQGTRACLKPGGSVILVVPTPEWLAFKLIDYAQGVEM